MPENENINVQKRNGELEKFDLSKINKMVSWAVKGLENVSLSDIEMNSRLNYREGITSKEIHESLIQSSVNLISVERPNYQYVAGRLLNYALRKDVWGGKTPPRLWDHLKRGIESEIYTKELTKWYSKKEVDKFSDYIDHDRDFRFTYAGIKQLCDKYLVQNRSTREIFETPQFAYMLIAMTCFHNYKGADRIKHVKKTYDAFSLSKINLPTPVMAGARTNSKSFASCCLIDVDDTMDSLMASASAVGHATSNRYGIGFNFGRIRAIGSPIRNGEVLHTGTIPFLKVFQSMVKSCQQGGLRGGSATTTIPIWAYEIQDVLVLKNNSGTDENRIRNLDYCISFSKLFYDRFIKNQPMTLFSYHEVPDLYDAFGTPAFDELYGKYENDETLKFKKTVSTRDLFSLFTKERRETGRYYVLNIDHCNEHGPWQEKVNMTNLCCEITHPLIPIQSLEDKNGEIGVCILSAINLLEITDDKDLENACDIIVKFLDEIIDYQNYFAPAAENFAKKRRSLGIGITNLAAFLAKNLYKYSDPTTPNFVDEWMEKIQFFLLKASMDLSTRKGPCEKFDKTKYALGVLPLDTYKRKMDEIVTRKPAMDWEWLRGQIKQHGLRHSTLTAIMPCESSSVIQNSTNGIEPVRDIYSYKSSKSGRIPFIVPGVDVYGSMYEKAYDLKDNIGLLNIVGAIQKWTDMAISANVYYNYSHYPNGTIKDSKLITEMMYAYSIGVKTLYYCNTDDGDSDQQLKAKEDDCVSGACKL